MKFCKHFYTHSKPMKISHAFLYTLNAYCNDRTFGVITAPAYTACTDTHYISVCM